VQYKYVMVFSGSVVQWEAGPNRLLQPGCLAEGAANLIEDVMYDLDDSIARRNSGVRIRFQEALEKGQLSGLDTSRFASSVPSPLRSCSAVQTPGTTSPRGATRELESVLRELVKLEPLHKSGRADVRRAAAAVRAAIEAERSSGRSRSRSRISSCAVLSLVMVPLLPFLVGSLILWRVPSSRNVSLRRMWPWAANWSGEGAADGGQEHRQRRRGRWPNRQGARSACRRGSKSAAERPRRRAQRNGADGKTTR